MALFICYQKCSTCKKAEKWLRDKEIAYTIRSIKEENPTREELETWHSKSGLDIRRFFNTSGKLYKEMKLKDRLSEMSLSEKLDLLAADGMLVKRPILVEGDTVLVGFKETEWEEALL